MCYTGKAAGKGRIAKVQERVVTNVSQIQKPLGYPVITGRPGAAAPVPARAPQATTGPSFNELLKAQLQKQEAPKELTFSRHARERTIERDISLSDTDLEKLGAAVGKAEDKGLTDTLVFMNNTAFIVNVPNRVVVTVVDGSSAENTVFTNIDGAVIV